MLWMPNLQINLRKQFNNFMEENPSGLFNTAGNQEVVTREVLLRSLT